MLLFLASPADNSRSPAYMEQVFAALREARLRVTFEYGSLHRQVGLFLRVPGPIVSAVRSAILARYPHCRLETLPAAALDPPNGFRVYAADLRLSPEVFPIRTHRQFDDYLERNTADPLAGLLAALSPRGKDGLWCKAQLHVVPAKPRQHRRARRIVKRLSRPAFRSHPMLAGLYLYAARSTWSRPLAWLLSSLTLASGVSSRLQPHEREDQLHAAVAKLDRHLFSARLRIIVAANADSSSRARRKIHEIAGAFGQFTAPGLSTFRLGPVRRSASSPRLRRKRSFLLSDEELATLWHPATQTVRAETMAMNVSRELEPPAVLPSKDEEGLAVLGRAAFRERRDVFGIRPDDRRRHVAIIGKTGMGKSTLLYRLIVSDIEAGRGVAFIDPHGDLADSILDAIPSRRTNDVVLFDAGDREHPVAYNPLACSDPANRPLIASGVVSAFKKLYGDSWGPRLEHILRNALLTLLETPGSTLLSIRPLLTETDFRRSVLAHVQDATLREFWEHEFAKWKPNFQAEAVAPILNKVGQFMSHPVLRGILDAPGRSLDLRRVMDEGQVLIVNLSKGRIGEDASTLLGSLLVSSLQLAAMSRADVPEEKRRDFFLYCDEFQNLATESFAVILSEARKYRLSLTIANQYLDQIDDATRAAVFGNVGTLLAFQVGAGDAEFLAGQLGGDATEQDLMMLPKYTAYVRLLIDGMPSRPFSMKTLPPGGGRRDRRRAEAIRRTSRRRYGNGARSATHNHALRTQRAPAR